MRRLKFNKLLFIVALLVLMWFSSCVSLEEDVGDEGGGVFAGGGRELFQPELLIAELGVKVDGGVSSVGSVRPLTNFEDKIWVGDEREFFEEGQAGLPDRLERFGDLTLVAPARSLEGLASELSSLIDMPVHVDRGHVGGVALVGRRGVRYRGGLRGLLDLLAVSFESVWRYDRVRRRLVFVRVLTRQFRFNAPIGVGSFGGWLVGKEAVREGADLDDEGILFSVDEASSIEGRDIWRGMREDLLSIMPDGSRVGLSPLTGQITVTTTPPAMRAVARLIRRRDERLSKQVYLNVQLLQLNVLPERMARAGSPLDLSSLLARASAGVLRIRDRSGDRVRGGDISGDERVGGESRMSDVSGVARGEGGRFVGSARSIDLVVEALRGIGEVSLLRSASGWTRNGRLLPLRSILRQAYVSRFRAGTGVGTGAGGGGADFESAVLRTGFLMRLRPFILSSGDIRLDLSMVLKSLTALTDQGEEDDWIQLPETLTRSWDQEAILPNGATLLLSGFENQQVVARSYQMMILLVTAWVVE